MRKDEPVKTRQWKRKKEQPPTHSLRSPSGNKEKAGLVYINKWAEHERDTGETHQGD